MAVLEMIRKTAEMQRTPSFGMIGVFNGCLIRHLNGALPCPGTDQGRRETKNSVTKVGYIECGDELINLALFVLGTLGDTKACFRLSFPWLQKLTIRK